MDVSTTSLQAFITLTQELHFGRTAEHLGVSQPTVSRHIKQVERFVGVPLVARTSRAVKLTEAGRVFSDCVDQALSALERGTLEARRVSAGRVGVLRLGFRNGLWLVPTIVRAQREQMPGVTLLLTEADEDEQIRQLIEHKLDLALTRRPADHSSLRCQVVHREPLTLAVARDHWAAGRSSLTLTDIAGEPFVMYRREHYRYVYDKIVRACRDAGFSTRISIEVDSPETAVALVAAGEGVTILSRGYARSHREVVDSIEIRDLAIDLHLTIRADASELVTTFAELLTSNLPAER